jgi:hypothetical protein
VVTDAGRFIAAAVDAMMPPQTWFAEHLAESARATTFLPCNRLLRESQILGIMRDFVRRRGQSAEGSLLKE